MNKQETGRGSAAGVRTAGGMADLKQSAGEALSGASDVAEQAVEKAKQVAAESASTVTHQVKDLLDRQVGSGADLVGHLASSAKRAADDLDQNAPQVAGLVRNFANRMDSYSDQLRGQSADQLMRSASEFTRRQPALVFGLTALAGFLAFRGLKNTPSIQSPSIQPTREAQGAGEFHGS